MTDLKALRALFDAATQGEWYSYDKYCNTDKRRLLGVSIPKGCDIAEVHSEDVVTTRSAEECKANALFIAATDPQTVRGLIDEIERKDSAIKDTLSWFEQAMRGNIMSAPDAGLIMRKLNEALGENT